MTPQFPAECSCGHRWSVNDPLDGLDAQAAAVAAASALVVCDAFISLPTAPVPHAHPSALPVACWTVIRREEHRGAARVHGQPVPDLTISGVDVTVRPHRSGAPAVEMLVHRPGKPCPAVRVITTVDDPNLRTLVAWCAAGDWARAGLASSLHGAEIHHATSRMSLARAVAAANLAYAAAA